LASGEYSRKANVLLRDAKGEDREEGQLLIDDLLQIAGNACGYFTLYAPFFCGKKWRIDVELLRKNRVQFLPNRMKMKLDVCLSLPFSLPQSKYTNIL